MMSFKKKLIRLHWFFSSQCGIDPLILLKSLRGIPFYIVDLINFKKKYSGKLNFMPCLHDRNAEGGATNNEYFWQDLLVARLVFDAKPRKHIDIGSRVDGFVAHVASFRNVEVFDVRPISAYIPGVTFKKADLMLRDSLPLNKSGYCDSISCLHAIEHFGLGRYGDPINPKGYVNGIENMAALLEKDGILYLSTPIGREKVDFNANRIFNPNNLISLAKLNDLEFIDLTIVDPKGLNMKKVTANEDLLELSDDDYHLGIFIFKKLTAGSMKSAVESDC